MEYSQLYKRVEQYVSKLFDDNRKDNLVFHNINHTKYVVDKTKEIAGHYQLSEREMLILFIAAWFHDTGYLFVKPSGHEEESVSLMRAFMEQQHPEEGIVDEVAGCIMATKHPRDPHGMLQKIISDADTYNFGTKDFKETNRLVFEELNFIDKQYISREDFNKKTYKMLDGHEYYTTYCQELLNKKEKGKHETPEKEIRKRKG